MRMKHLLLLALAIAFIYTLPTAIARFVGTHTWEINQTNGSRSINCVRCHSYILDELNTNTLTNETHQKHKNAAGNSSYTQGWLNLTIYNSSDFSVCQLCHLNQLSATPSHTKVTIRTCVDLDCHGSNATTNNTAYAAGLMGPKLGGSNESAPTNVHMRAFNQMSALNSSYLNETGDNYKQGFYFCLGCHTYIEFGINYNGTESYAHDNSSDSRRRYL